MMQACLKAGLSKVATARRIGVTRRTVYNWIAAGELERDPDDHEVQYRPRPPVPSMLDPYKDIIEARLAEYPELSAARLYREVRAKGYAGGYGQVKRHVRTTVRSEDALGARGCPRRTRGRAEDNPAG